MERGCTTPLGRARALAAAALSTAILLGSAAGARADMEWCDSGSPPPNDFRLHQTASQSGQSSLNWLRSTDGGDDLLAAADAGEFNTTQLSAVSGGVADGMRTATSHALRRSRDAGS